jgi:type II secretory pathway pseudopilin PulG
MKRHFDFGGFAITAKGFTLIELVIIIMVLGISSVALVSLYGQVGSAVTINHDINSAAELAQECGEYLLAQRRNNGYAMSGISDCSALPAFNSYGPPAVALTDPYSGAGCPAGASCKLFNINATYNTGNAVADLVVVNY